MAAARPASAPPAAALGLRLLLTFGREAEGRAEPGRAGPSRAEKGRGSALRRGARRGVGRPVCPRKAAGKMSAPTMQERKACWGARDEFWQCLEAHAEDAARCEELRLAFESRCPQQWVKYFDKRRDFLKYKKKLEAEGFHPPETAGKA